MHLSAKTTYFLCLLPAKVSLDYPTMLYAYYVPCICVLWCL